VAGYILTTDLDRQQALSAAIRAARAEGFRVRELTECEFVARRSNLAASLLMGPFVAYCNFHVRVLDNHDGVDVVVQRNYPWWTGSGLRGVRLWAKRLANAIDRMLEKSGGRVLDRLEY
jgi:hypothetical protein